MLPIPLLVLPLNLALLMGRVSNHLSPSRHAAALCLKLPLLLSSCVWLQCAIRLSLSKFSLSCNCLQPFILETFLFFQNSSAFAITYHITSVDLLKSGTKALVPVPLDGILVPLG